MATYVIGDIQGCFEPLQRLLAVVGFDPAHDRLWLVGDLVNRGPDNVAVLRWASGLRDRVVAVLGNHDLHLLARAWGVAGPRKRDTVDDVLRADDREALVAWLRARPLLHRADPYVMMHAGLLPHWSVDEAEQAARACEAVLRSERGPALLAASLDDDKATDRSLAPHVAFLAACTRLRTCTALGSACTAFSGPPEQAPPGCMPWFAVPGRQSASHVAVFGHWAALGLRVQPGVVAVDSGCVWGRELSAVRLEDRAVFQVPARG